MPPLERNNAAIGSPHSRFANSASPLKLISSPGGGAPPALLKKIEPEVDGTALTLFGLARILQVRSKGVIKCHLKSSPSMMLMLNETSYQVLSQTATVNMSDQELADYALRLQSFATKEWKLQNAGIALKLFERVLAVSTSLLQKRTLSQEERGNWLIRTIKCNTTAAQIAIQLHQYSLALEFTKESLTVLDALERPTVPTKIEKSEDAKTQTPTEDDDESSGGGSSVSSFASNTESGGTSGMYDVGRVKLFGECRIKALLLTAQALLELSSSQKSLVLAALRLLEQAQKLLRKYSDPKYRSQPEFRSTMKALLSLQTDLKRLKKRAKTVIKPKEQNPHAVVATADGDESVAAASSFTSWFRPRRVWFADDEDKSVTVSETRSIPAVNANTWENTASSWRRDTVVYGGIITGGLVLFHYMLRQRRR